MEKFSGSCVPMLQSAVGIHRDDNVLGHSLRGHGSPSQLSGGHWIFHAIVQDIGLFACEHIIDTDSTITASLSDVFVVWVEPHAEGLLIKRTQCVLVANFDVGILHLFQLKFFR